MEKNAMVNEPSDEKGNHAAFGREDALKFYFRDLPTELQSVISRRRHRLRIRFVPG